MKSLYTLAFSLLALTACKKESVEPPYQYRLLTQPSAQTTVAACNSSLGGSSGRCLQYFPSTLFSIGAGGLVGKCGIATYQMSATPHGGAYVGGDVRAARVFVDAEFVTDYESYSPSTYPAETLNAYRSLLASGRCGI
jgi:hypothetical protein